MSILVVMDHSEGKPRRVALEALSTATALNLGPVSALAFGPGAAELAGAAGQHGAQELLALSDPPFARYSSDACAAALAAVVRERLPRVVLFGATAFGKDLAPRVSGLLRAGLVSDCTGVEAQGDSIVVKRPVYAGKAFQRVRIVGAPALVSIRPNVQPVRTSGHGPAPVTVPAVTVPEPRAVVTATERNQGETVELTEADRIVSGGRGMKSGENFKLLDELAAVLGAAVGSSRPVADEGWVPHSYHVGQTGKVVSPDLYVAVGISGAIQHVAGISNSKCIVAINSDPDAPIFKVANYGIVGDLFQVVPALTAALREHMAAS
jgi:electron transfer flavoprotein alpha subunit